MTATGTSVPASGASLIPNLGFMRFAPFAALVLLTGCTSQQAGPAPTASESSASTSTSPAAAKTGPHLAGASRNTDWTTFVQPCPDPAKKPLIQQVVTADITGDGIADTLVARACESSTIEVFDGSSPAQQPRRIDQPLLSSPTAELRRPWVTSLEVTSGEIIIKANGHALDDRSKTCPRDRLVFTYMLAGTEFTQLRLATDPAGTCLPTT